MFLDFFFLLKSHGIPVSLHEQLSLMDAMKKNVVGQSVDDFYYLCRTIMVKQESNLDRFDKLFGQYFKGIEIIDDDFFLKQFPKEWLRKNLEKHLTPEEMAAIEALGGFEALMERFKELMEKQKERHEGGNQWIGTGGTSPFGADGYNPEGYRIQQNKSRHRKAVKIWEKREFKNFDDQVELNTRNMKVALKRLRHFTREGIPTEIDVDETIDRTSKSAGILDISIVPSRKNRIKVLMLMDVGGSMDDHVAMCSRLFSAAKFEFKYLEYFYFHNCLYESVWKDNKLRFEDRIPTLELLNKYNKDYKVIFVGDAAMSPYEIMYKGGSIEHYNDEPGIRWLERVRKKYTHTVWINPNPEYSWQYFESTKIIQEVMDNRMYPMTIDGLTNAMKALKDKQKKHETMIVQK